jgi:hypothetical protein
MRITAQLDIPPLNAYNKYIMAQHRTDQIVPKDFPELAMLAWNRDIARPIDRDEAFQLYERNWRFVDAGRLGAAETKLIKDLSQEFGHGQLLVA